MARGVPVASGVRVSGYDAVACVSIAREVAVVIKSRIVVRVSPVESAVVIGTCLEVPGHVVHAAVDAAADEADAGIGNESSGDVVGNGLCISPRYKTDMDAQI